MPPTSLLKHLVKSYLIRWKSTAVGPTTDRPTETKWRHFADDIFKFIFLNENGWRVHPQPHYMLSIVIVDCRDANEWQNGYKTINYYFAAFCDAFLGVQCKENGSSYKGVVVWCTPGAPHFGFWSLTWPNVASKHGRKISHEPFVLFSPLWILSILQTIIWPLIMIIDINNKHERQCQFSDQFQFHFFCSDSI